MQFQLSPTIFSRYHTQINMLLTKVAEIGRVIKRYAYLFCASDLWRFFCFPFCLEHYFQTAFRTDVCKLSFQTYTTIDTGPRGYQNFSIDFEVNGEPQTVDRIEVTFNRACDTHPCFGLNDIFGRYTVLEPGEGVRHTL